MIVGSYGGDPTGGGHFSGYMSDVRIVNGTGLYSSSFTPPTAPLSAVSNTSVLLKMQNAGIVDSAMQKDLITAGTTQISTSVYKYGTGSIYFPGSSYLTSQLLPQNGFGSGNFTIESWVYFSSSVSTGQVLFNQGYESGTTRSYVIYFNSDNTLRMAYSPDGSTNSDNGFGSLGLSTNTWYHIAIVRNGSTITAYKNGTALGSTINIGTTAIANLGLFKIGLDSTNYFTGYMDDIRITNGIARYTTNFTPSTTAFVGQ
jgi:hypothetical protein